MAEAKLPDEKQSREGAQRVAELVKKNIDSPQEARTCKLVIQNNSKFQMSNPMAFPMCCRSVGDPPPHIRPNGEDSMIFSKPRWKPLGCSGLMSYLVETEPPQRLVILFRNPMLQFTRRSKSASAVLTVSANAAIDEDLYKDMAFNWDRHSSNYHKQEFQPKLGKKQIAADGEAELWMNDILVKFYMTQDTNANLTVKLLPGRRVSKPRACRSESQQSLK